MPKIDSKPMRFRLTTALAMTLALLLTPQLIAGEKTMKKKKAKAIHKVMAEYPETARAEKIEGTVVAELTIQADGTVSAVEIKEGDALFHEATIEALEQWKFEPRPAATDFQVTVNFRLDGDKKAAGKEI